MSEEEQEEQPLVSHLIALRRAIIHSLIAVFFLMVLSFAFADRIYSWLMAPLAPELATKGLKLIIISPLEQAVTYIKLSFFCGLCGTVPIILREIWLFVTPALKKREKRFLLPVITIGTMLFASGLAVCYCVVLPYAMAALIAWVPPSIETALSMERYLTTTLQLMFGFGLVFETPLIISMLIISGLVPLDKFRKIRKFYIIGAFITAALLTPPDPLSQIMMAIPLLLFFELGLQLGRLLRP